MVARALSPNDIAPFLRNVLSSSLRSIKSRRKHGARKIGVCVSGGPDSMALAYLLQGLSRSERDNLHLSAWIVDHKARLESTREAEQVSANLARIGVHSTILTMQWADNVEPLDLSDFESQARTKRYQLLALAARKHGIEHLFLGHHQDDQVETILMRLIRNQNPGLRGLAGMAATSSVPDVGEVFKVHGAAHISLPKRTGAAHRSTGKGYVPSKDREQRTAAVTWHDLAVPGHVVLHRPLLPFRKIDLVTTCESNNVPYVIDPTNKDPRSSLRNSVRYLRENHMLPFALSRQRVLELQKNAQRYLKRTKAEGEIALSKCSILSLDLRSGVVKAHVPCKEDEGTDAVSWAYAISKLTEIVTANSRVAHSTGVPSDILSRFCAHSESSSSPLKPFTHDKVLFTPDPTRRQTWILSRELMRPNELVRHTRSFEAGTVKDPDLWQVSRWMLWDNRFWIRASLPADGTFDNLQIRPLLESDMRRISQQLEDDSKRDRFAQIKMLDALRRAAPGKVRFTLPVITYGEQIVALPTIGHMLYGPLREANLSGLHWEVYYNTFSLLSQPSKTLHINHIA